MPRTRWPVQSEHQGDFIVVIALSGGLYVLALFFCLIGFLFVFIFIFEGKQNEVGG